MEHLEFFMPMAVVPTATHQMQSIGVRNGKPYVYEPDSVKNARQKFMAHLAAHIPEAPMQGPISLMVKWCFPIIGKHVNGEYKTTKSDLDNLAKQLLDVMTVLGFWKDDAQIACLILEKFWASRPGIFIRIRNLEGEQV